MWVSFLTRIRWKVYAYLPCLILLIASEKLKCFTRIVSLIYDSAKTQSWDDLFVSCFVYSVSIVVTFVMFLIVSWI